MTISDEPVLLAGVMSGQPFSLFLNIKDGLDMVHYKRHGIILIRMIVNILKRTDAPVYAVAEDIPTARSLIAHVGFKEITDGVFLWHRPHRS